MTAARSVRMNALLLIAALLLSFGALFNTLLVTVQNLGDRDGIRYINGGKIFFERGAMWYHTPGLRRLGLAPQNIGGQANLRNNDFALFEPPIEVLESMQVEFSLAPGAFMLVVLDHPEHGGEGTLRALRLTAFEQPDTPFVNAVVRYEEGRVVERVALSELGAQLQPGRHQLQLDVLADDRLRVAVDGRTVTVDFSLRDLQPYPALGSGELDLTVHRWAVTGRDMQGRRFSWEQSWPLGEVLSRNLVPIAQLSVVAWLLLFGLLLGKVSIEARRRPDLVLIDGLLLPRPRAIYGLITLIPLTPMVLQWLLMFNYVALCWIGLVGQIHVDGGPWRVPLLRRAGRASLRQGTGRGIWLVGGVLVLGGVALLASATLGQRDILGTEAPLASGQLIAVSQPMRPLVTGQRLLVPLSDAAYERLSLSFRVVLEEGQAARVDLLQSLPTDADVFQVDRNAVIDRQAAPEAIPSDAILPGLPSVSPRGGSPDDHREHDDHGEHDGRDEHDAHREQGDHGEHDGRDEHDGPGQHDGHEGEEGEGPSNYAFRAVSLLLSRADGLPSELRKGWNFDMLRSPHGGWDLGPGEHLIELHYAEPVAVVTVNGVLVDYRGDFLGTFSSTPGPGGLPDREASGSTIAGVQVLPQTPNIAGVGDVKVWVPLSESAPDPSSALALAAASLNRGAVLATLGTVLLSLGLFLWLVAALCRLPLSRGTLFAAALRWLRAHAFLLACLWMWLRRDASYGGIVSEKQLLFCTSVAVIMASVNLWQVLRSGGTGWRRQVLAAVLCAVYGLLVFEGASRAHPDWRHQVSTYWNHNLSPQFHWVYDPMLRRLNPWFVDQRFKRRDYLGSHEGKRRVVVLGGSQTFGWGIPSEDRMTFSDQLADALYSRGYEDVEVMNAAFPGVKTTTGLRWLEGVALRYQPDVLVVNFVVNEFMDVDPYHVWSGVHQPTDQVAPAAALAWLRRLPRDIQCSHLVQIVLAHKYEILEMEQSLRRIVETSRARGIKVVFSIEPTNIYVESAGAVIMRNDVDIGAAVAVYERLGAELGVPVYNVLPHFLAEAENLWFYDTMHMSRLGHKVFADNLGALIDAEVFGGR